MAGKVSGDNMVKPEVSALFLDIGGVLLTNGWDRGSRRKAAQQFHLDYDQMDERHHLTFDTYELGKLTLDEYLSRVVFYQKRDFTKEDFIEFMYAQSKPFPDMIQLVKKLKERYCFKVACVSNEGRELTEYRIEKFGLNDFVDFFISSCFVHFRKPDADIFHLALDTAQVPKGNVVYVDDRDLFVEVASRFGLRTILHHDLDATRAELARFGLVEE